MYGIQPICLDMVKTWLKFMLCIGSAPVCSVFFVLQQNGCARIDTIGLHCTRYNENEIVCFNSLAHVVYEYISDVELNDIFFVLTGAVFEQ